MKELITIVIPCKNERELIGKTLSYLDNQNDISGVNVIIADSSTDDTMDIIVRMSFKSINVTFTDGGIPSVARNNGADLVKTPYVLFLDADMFLVNPDTIKDCLVEADKYDLISCRFRINGEYSFVFPAFEFVRDLFMWYSPCIIGGFMLFNTHKFINTYGKFDETAIIAEDYLISSKINPNLIKIINHNIFTTNRRFKNKGLWYMIKIMILATINKNNHKFFTNDRNYWI